MISLMIRSRAVILVCGLLTALAAVGCQEESPNTDSSGKLVVAVTIDPQAWLVEQIGGEHVDVRALVPSDASPETFQPTDRDVSRITSAVVYFRLGVPVEQGRWFDGLRSSGDLKIVDASRDMPWRYMSRHRHHAHGHEEPANKIGHHEEQGGEDPHRWLSPRLLKMQAHVIAVTLAQLDAEHAGTYARRLQSFETEMDELDQSLRHLLGSVEGKAFLVFHPAWGYFADEYDLQQLAIEMEGNTPSDYELTQLQRLVRQHRLRVLFVSPQDPSELAHAVARALDVQVNQVDPLARDVAENLVRTAKAIADSYR